MDEDSVQKFRDNTLFFYMQGLPDQACCFNLWIVLIEMQMSMRVFLTVGHSLHISAIT